MNDHQVDRMLSIKTTGLQKEMLSLAHHYQYEPTPFSALNQLFSTYEITESDRFVDMGCGKGRVAFYVHHRFQASVLGVELNKSLYEKALKNKTNYLKNLKRKRGRIDFICTSAQTYNIQPEDNIFFFFNPFSEQVFMKVVQRILLSTEQFPRTIDIILYYPSNEYIYYLLNKTSFKVFEEVRLEGIYERNENERFLIYRLEE